MPKLVWFSIALGALGPVACAQVAGLDQRYVAEDDDGGSQSDAAAAADARQDARAKGVDTCEELSPTNDTCARCVIFDVKATCQGVCNAAVKDSVRETYFNCLRANDDARKCANQERFGVGNLLDAQNDCIDRCQERGFCNKK